MPSLRDLNSSLSDLPFGKDQPGGGSSNEPYVKRKIGQQWTTPGDPLDLIAKTTRTVGDLVRITKFFADPIKGPLFLAKQVSLQLQNVQLEHRTDRTTNNPTTGQGFFRNTLNGVENVVNRIENEIGPTRIYNPLGTNTLAQIEVQAFGGHLVRHGLLPLMEDNDKYEAVVEFNNDNNNNRLVKLRDQFNNVDTDEKPIAQYKGGPGSRLGIGETVIHKAKDVNSLSRQDNIVEKKFTLLRNFVPISNRQITSIDEQGKIENSGDVRIPDFDFRKRDFREYKQIIKQTDQKDQVWSDYENLNMEKRIGIARARREDEFQTDYTIDVPDAADKVNMVGPYYSTTPGDGTDVNGQSVTEPKIRDLIKFRIKAVDNDNPAAGVFMVFRAFLSDINRRIDAKWNQFQYVGRGESFYTYDGFTDILSFEFTIVAHSRMEMKPLYQKLNYLYSTLTPDYKSNKMRGTIHELTIGDYIKYQPGIITSLYIGIPQEVNWEIAMNSPDSQYGGRDKDMHELPMILKCGINFKPIYNFLPQKSVQRSPFIGIDQSVSGSNNAWIGNRVGSVSTGEPFDGHIVQPKRTGKVIVAPINTINGQAVPGEFLPG